MRCEEYWNKLVDELLQLWQDVRPLLQKGHEEIMGKMKLEAEG